MEVRKAYTGTSEGLSKEKRTWFQNVAKLHPTGLAPSRARRFLLYRTTTKMHDLETTGFKDPIPTGPTIILLHTRPML